MCFTNGVYDLKNGVFRDGLPEDYITKTTNLFYEPVDEDIPQHKKRIAEIHDFMAKLFPIPEVREYMWEHLASTLVGESTPTTQTLHMYVGAGCNGKSALVDLMAMILGEYRAVAPLSLITDKRAKLGGTSTEIIELKGVRYAVLNEPSVDDIINEGVMKSLTGGTDQIQGRALYQNKTISYNPQFKLVVCSNVLMKVRSNDDGTWRRIRVIDFISKFVAHPDPNIPYQFKIEPINKKFSEWKELFMAMLIEIAVRTQGNVCECAQVMKSSQAYKDGQDIFADFIDARIRIDPDRELKFSDLSAQIALWFTNEKERPDKKKILEYFKKKYGEPVGKGIATTWRGIYIEKQEDTDSEEEDEDP
jgi:P4 family phage/plasmid primase-like protien